MTAFLDFFIAGLTRGSMYALIALGYTLVYGVLQLINFAHSEVFMSGAFGSYLIVHWIVGDGSQTKSWQVPLVIIVGLIAGALTGAGVAWSLERVAYRPPESCSTASPPTRFPTTSKPPTWSSASAGPTSRRSSWC
jgi:branched-chain amino acid transport system permease protein